MKPQLATLVDGPPNDAAEWAYDIKFDGYRILARIDGQKIQLFTRNGNDWSHKLPHLVKAIDEMNLGNGWFDGEVIVPNAMCRQRNRPLGMPHGAGRRDRETQGLDLRFPSLPNWIKLKCSQRQEFVIGGYTDPQGTRVGIGSLLLGYYDEEKKLRYAGNVGTGFSDKTLRDLKAKLDTVTAAENPFFKAMGIGRKVHWVKPTLVAEVSFGEWTREGRIALDT